MGTTFSTPGWASRAMSLVLSRSSPMTPNTTLSVPSDRFVRHPKPSIRCCTFWISSCVAPFFIDTIIMPPFRLITVGGTHDRKRRGRGCCHPRPLFFVGCDRSADRWPHGIIPKIKTVISVGGTLFLHGFSYIRCRMARASKIFGETSRRIRSLPGRCAKPYTRPSLSPDKNGPCVRPRPGLSLTGGVG